MKNICRLTSHVWVFLDGTNCHEVVSQVNCHPTNISSHNIKVWWLGFTMFDDQTTSAIARANLELLCDI
jgi:hypothetical protein